MAFLTAAFAYALIVFGAAVRITESGLGCGPEWPRCNGRFIPLFTDYHVVIEYVHRLAALGLIVLIVALASLAVARRTVPGVAGKGGVLRPVLLAVVLLLVQVILGAITVWLDLHASAIVLHLGTAMGLLAALLVAGLRAAEQSRGVATTSNAAGPPSRATGAAVAMGAIAVLAGGLTAATGASTACRGFPLCNGLIWPDAASGGLAQIQWTHRLIAYSLFVFLVAMAIRIRAHAFGEIRRWTWIAASVAALQVVVAAIMILTHDESTAHHGLHAPWAIAHVAVGTAVWASLVILAWHGTRSLRTIVV